MRIRQTPYLTAVLAAALALTVPSAARAETQADYLAAAQQGAAAARQFWWDPRRGWYRQQHGGHGARPLATLWGLVPLFETLDAIAIAAPGSQTRSAVASFARGAERYWDPALEPAGGYQPYKGVRMRVRAWFDDNGWWGIAFVDAYRATGNSRYLRDAERAFAFIDAAGWDPVQGGIWWSTIHEHKAGESVAAGTLLAARLYEVTGDPYYLAEVHKLVLWANSNFVFDGLYERREDDPRAAVYIQGPLIAAQAEICKRTGDEAYCQQAEAVAQLSLERFTVTTPPIYDSIYLRDLLDLYRIDGDPRWYQAASDAAQQALANARDSNGLFLRGWDGNPVTGQGIVPGMLQTHAATVSLFAWLATVPPPGS